MENFNNASSEKANDSDIESAAGENDLLYQFIFGKSDESKPKPLLTNGHGAEASKKASVKPLNSSFKNGKA